MLRWNVESSLMKIMMGGGGGGEGGWVSEISLSPPKSARRWVNGERNNNL